MITSVIIFLVILVAGIWVLRSGILQQLFVTTPVPRTLKEKPVSELEAQTQLWESGKIPESITNG